MQESHKPIIAHIRDFLEYTEIERGFSKSTQRNYQGCLKRFEKWLSSSNKEDIKPHELTIDDVWQYRVYLSKYIDRRGKLLSKCTQNYYLTTLRGLLSYFLLRDITSLPTAKVTLSKETDRNQRRMKFLSLEQIKKLLDAPDATKRTGLRDKVILETLFSTGLRVAELAALNKKQFDSIWNQEDLELSIIGKGNHQRMIFFSKRVLVWLRRYVGVRNDSEKALFINNRKENGCGGHRLSTRSIERIIKNYAVKSGLPDFTTPHTLRHSYATDLLSQGADLRTVQELLGHRNIMTTQLYTHVTNKQLRDVHRQFHGGRSLDDLDIKLEAKKL